MAHIQPGLNSKIPECKVKCPIQFMVQDDMSFPRFFKVFACPCVCLKMVHSTIIKSCYKIFGIFNHKTMFSTES